MSIFCWIVAAFMTLGAVSTVASVGKPKKPTTGGAAATAMLIDAVIVTGLVLIATGTWHR